MGEYDQRLARKLSAERSLSRSPNNPKCLRMYANAIADLAMSCMRDPKRTDEWAPLLDEAIARYRDLLTVDPNNGPILTNLGAALSDRGQHKDAVKVLRQAVLHSPTDRHAHFNLAVALMNTGDAGRRKAQLHFNDAGQFQKGVDTREAYFDPHGY